MTVKFHSALYDLGQALHSTISVPVIYAKFGNKLLFSVLRPKYQRSYKMWCMSNVILE